jgi:hypothetical protein
MTHGMVAERAAMVAHIQMATSIENPRVLEALAVPPQLFRLSGKRPTKTEHCRCRKARPSASPR